MDLHHDRADLFNAREFGYVGFHSQLKRLLRDLHISAFCHKSDSHVGCWLPPEEIDVAGGNIN